MPKLTIKDLEQQIKDLRELRQRNKDAMRHYTTQIEGMKERLRLIAAENESLRMDKKWLQQIHSNFLQSLCSSGNR